MSQKWRELVATTKSLALKQKNVFFPKNPFSERTPKSSLESVRCSHYNIKKRRSGAKKVQNHFGLWDRTKLVANAFRTCRDGLSNTPMQLVYSKLSSRLHTFAHMDFDVQDSVSSLSTTLESRRLNVPIPTELSPCNCKCDLSGKNGNVTVFQSGNFGSHRQTLHKAH